MMLLVYDIRTKSVPYDNMPMGMEFIVQGLLYIFGGLRSFAINIELDRSVTG
jgi:hypothetical protein